MGYVSPEKENVSSEFVIEEQTYEVQLTMRIFTCLCPIIFLVIAAFIVFFYPVTKTTAAEMRKKKQDSQKTVAFD